MADRVVVHVGLPKAGSSYLQELVWSARADLARAGVLVPGRERRDHLWASRTIREDPDLARPQRRAVDKRSAWARLRTEIASWPGLALISHEFLAAASAGQVRRLVADLAPARVEVVVVGRDPLGLLVSSWQENLKNGATVPLEEYALGVSADPRDVWDWRALDLRLVVQRWLGVLPADQVHVLCLDTAAPPSRLWAAMAGVLGVEAAAYDAPSVPANPSLGLVEAEALRRVNAHLQGFTSAWDRGVFIRTHLADERLVPRRGEPFWPSPERVEECRRRAASTAAWLAAQEVCLHGDPELLLVPTELASRRSPGSVSEAEVVEVTAALVAALLADIRELRSGGSA